MPKRKPDRERIRCPRPDCGHPLEDGYCWKCGTQAGPMPAQPVPRPPEPPINRVLAQRAMQILGEIATKAVSVERGRAMLYEEFPEEMGANREEL